MHTIQSLEGATQITMPRLLFGAVFKETWQLFKKGFWPFLLLGILTQWINPLVQAIPPTWPHYLRISMLLGLISMFLNIIGSAWIVSSADVLASFSEKISLSKAMSLREFNILSLIGAMILVLMVGFIGIILFIIPGVLFWFFTCLYVPAIVCEKTSVWSSIKRSFQLMKLHFFKASWIIFCGGLIGLFLWSVSLSVSPDHSPIVITLTILIAIVASALGVAFFSVLLLVLFRNLRQIEIHRREIVESMRGGC